MKPFDNEGQSGKSGGDPGIKWTPGPWRWQGEDYRGGWGWQILVGPKGEGLIVGEDSARQPCFALHGFIPVDPALCITGLAAEGKSRVRSVHVLEPEAHLIAAAPELYAALEGILRCVSLPIAESVKEWMQVPGPLEIARRAMAKARGDTPLAQPQNPEADAAALRENQDFADPEAHEPACIDWDEIDAARKAKESK